MLETIYYLFTWLTGGNRFQRKSQQPMTVARGVAQCGGLRLDGDAALALDVHRVEHLRFHGGTVDPRPVTRSWARACGSGSADRFDRHVLCIAAPPSAP